MYRKEGYWNVEPRIKRLSFPRRGKFQVDLQDGRSITMPISAFPSLKRVPVKERNNWYLMGGGVTWDSCPEVIHIEQILGNFQNYSHEQSECSTVKYALLSQTFGLRPNSLGGSVLSLARMFEMSG